MPARDCIVLALVLLLSSAVDVVGTTSCPTGDQVAAQLASILPAPDTNAPRDRLQFQEIGDRIYVRLENPAGATLAERTFERSDDCAALALAIAVTVAAWESDLHPELPATPPPGVDRRDEPSEVEREDAPATPATVEPEDAPATPATANPPVPTPQPETGPRRGVESEVFWGLGGSLAASHPGGVGVFGAGLRAPGRRESRPGFGALGVVPLPGREKVGALRLSFWRPVALARLWIPVAKLGAARVEVEPALGASALWVSDGRRKEVLYEPVVGIGSRLDFGRGRRLPWISLDGLFWPMPQILLDRMSGHRVRFPDWQLIVSAGLALRGGPRP